MSEYVPSAMGADGEDFVVGYMCMTDFEWELGMASGGNRVFPSVEDLRSNFKCVDGCGIVEVKVLFSRVIHLGRWPEDSEA